MSYEVWGDDDADDLYERISEAGGLVPEEVDELRALLDHYEFPDPFPRPGNRNDAIMIILEHKITPPPPDKPEDPHITWAKSLLKDIL